MYIQTSIVRQNVYKAAEFGADFAELCRRLNLTPDILANGEAYLPYSPGKEHDFWTHALELTKDPCLGLHMGQSLDRYNTFGILGMLAGASKTIGEAMEVVARYNETWSGVMQYRLTVDGEEAGFEMTPLAIWETSNLESARQAVDMSISGWLTAINQLSQRKVTPLRTELKYEKRFEREYKAVLQSPMRFHMPLNRMVFSKADIETPLISHDPTLIAAFEHIVREKQRQYDSRNTISARVRQILLSVFHGQITNIDVIADSLFMTTRTLQRKLAEEKTSYREICNSLRRDLTTDLLKAGKTNKAQVASMLGYHDTSSFNKAFRSWKNGN